LTTLDISHNSLNELSFSSPDRPSQAVLDFRKDNAFLTSFPGSPKRSRFVAEDIDQVLPSLRQLSLQGNSLTNTGLPLEWPELLEHLDVSGNKLSGQWDVSGLAACKNLESLVAVKNNVTGLCDSGAEGRWPSLKTLDLSQNGIVQEDNVIAIIGKSGGLTLVSIPDIVRVDIILCISILLDPR
jgi:Leucine-rich repeat (LRR) protein